MNIVGYIRLSRDEDKQNFSSINAQKSIINDYAKENDWIISKMFIDDNYSGYTFDRPGFNLLKSDLEKGKIDIIICKDFSRIGRKQGQSMVFVDTVKDCGSRLIFATENYDSEKEDELLGIHAWYNEHYVRDISKKIRASMVTGQKNGGLMMGNYFGYTKIKEESKSRLVVDEQVRPIIEIIFQAYIDGLGYKKICDILDKNNFMTPSEYIRQQHEDRGRIFKNKISTKWQTHMIQRIIINDIYVGTLTTNKRHAKLIKGKQERVPKEDQYKFEMHHEAIISQDNFQLANKINRRKVNNNFRNKSNYDYIFSGFVRCNDCGYTAIGLNLGKKPTIKRGYNCTTYQRYGKAQCLNHSISEEKLLELFIQHLEEIREIYIEILKNINLEKKKRDIVNNVDRLKKELIIANKELKLVLTQKIKDLMKETNPEYREIIEETYTTIETEKKKKIIDLNQKVQEVEKLSTVDIIIKLKTNIETFDEIIGMKRPTKKLLERVLEKILLKEDRNADFILKDDITLLING